VVRFGAEAREVGAAGAVGLVTGEQLEAQVIVGADRINSATRPRCSATVNRAQAGVVAYRAVVDAWDGALAAGEYWGRGEVFGVAPLSRRRAYWYAAYRAEPAGDAGEDRLAGLLARHGSWAEPIPRLLAATRPQALLRHELFDRTPIDAWGRDAVTLLGDAGHPMLPILGQGACCALEDAVALGAALRDTDIRVQRSAPTSGIALRGRATSSTARAPPHASHSPPRRYSRGLATRQWRWSQPECGCDSSIGSSAGSRRSTGADRRAASLRQDVADEPPGVGERLRRLEEQRPEQAEEGTRRPRTAPVARRRRARARSAGATSQQPCRSSPSNALRLASECKRGRAERVHRPVPTNERCRPQVADRPVVLDSHGHAATGSGSWAVSGVASGRARAGRNATASNAPRTATPAAMLAAVVIASMNDWSAIAISLAPAPPPI
jgi:FAD binding domain